jgi:hypothetical protein
VSVYEIVDHYEDEAARKNTNFASQSMDDQRLRGLLTAARDALDATDGTDRAHERKWW